MKILIPLVVTGLSGMISYGSVKRQDHGRGLARKVGLPLLWWKLALGIAVGAASVTGLFQNLPYLRDPTALGALLRGTAIGLLFLLLVYPFFLSRVRPRLSAKTKRGAASYFPVLAVVSEFILFSFFRDPAQPL